MIHKNTKRLILIISLTCLLGIQGQALAQQYSYGVFDYAYVDPNAGNVTYPTTNDTAYTDYTGYSAGMDQDLSNLSDADYNKVTAILDRANEKPLALNRPILNQLKLSSEATTTQPEKLDKETVKKEILEKLQQDNAQQNNKGNGIQSFLSDYWLQFLAMIVSVIGVVLAVSGFSLANQKRQKNLKKYFHEIDDVYSSYKWKTKRCEAELYRLQDVIEHQLKEGKIDENTFNILEKRIQKYLDEIKYAEERPNPAPTNPVEQQETAQKLAEQIDQAAKQE